MKPGASRCGSADLPIPPLRIMCPAEPPVEPALGPCWVDWQELRAREGVRGSVERAACSTRRRRCSPGPRLAENQVPQSTRMAPAATPRRCGRPQEISPEASSRAARALSGSFAHRRPRPTSRSCRQPSPTSPDLGGESPLPVDRPHQPIDVDELGLELDHEEAATRSMPGEPVDGPALAIEQK